MGWSLLLGGMLFLLGMLLLYFAAVQRAIGERFLSVRHLSLREIADTPPPPDTLVEVRGSIACDAPVTAALSRQPCAFFASSVRERVEETTWEENRRPGQLERQVRIVHRLLEERTDRVPFWLVDQEHRLFVDPHGAEIEGKTSVDRFLPAEIPPRPPTPDLARSFAASVETPSEPASSPERKAPPPERRVLGTQQWETLLPLGATIGVIGSLQEREGKRILAKSPSASSLFLITERSLEDLVGAAQRAARFWLIAGGGACLLGLFIFLLGFR